MEQKDNNAIVSEFTERLQYSKDGKLYHSARWYMNQAFIESGEYYRFNTQTKQLEKSNNKKNNKHVSKARAQIRGIKNTILKNDPRWNAKKATYEGKFTEEEALISQRLLKDIFKRDNLKDVLKDTVHAGLLKWFWVWQLYYDWDKICVLNVDPFDIYTAPNSLLRGPEIISDWLIKAVRMTIWEIKWKLDFNDGRLSITPDNQAAEDESKIAVETLAWRNVSGKGDDATAIVYEYYKIEDKKLCVYTICNKKVLKKAEPNFDKIPFLFYQPERMEGKLYVTPWATNMIQLNKTINKLYSDLMDFVNTVSKGRYLAKTGSNISQISNENWQIVYYDNVPPAFLQPWSPGEMPTLMLSKMESWLEWVGWVTGASILQSMEIRSGVQIAQLQASDVFNVSEPVAQLETFLSRAGNYILSLASKNYSTTKKLYSEDKDEIEIIGEEAAAENEKTLPGMWKTQAKRIKPFEGIEVQIIPGTAFSQLAVRQDLMELKKAWFPIPDELIIETFELWDTAEILRKINIEKEENSNPDVEIATGENKKMMMWQQVTANPTDDHRVHLALHAQLLQSVRDNQQVAVTVAQHIKQHESFIQWPVMDQMKDTLWTPPAPTPTEAPLEEQPIPEWGDAGPEMDPNEAWIWMEMWM